MTGRVLIETSVDIAKPPDVVYAYLADVTKHGEWSPKAYRVEDVSGPVAQGTTFTSYGWVPGDKDHRNEVEVTTYDPPRILAFTSSEKGEKFVNTFTLTPSGSGTRVDRVMDMPKPGGFVGVLFPVFVPTVVRPAVAKGMRMLKERVEAP
jgi:uncharacterized protein YndB with AHSA1/START domain